MYNMWSRNTGLRTFKVDVGSEPHYSRDARFVITDSISNERMQLCLTKEDALDLANFLLLSFAEDETS